MPLWKISVKNPQNFGPGKVLNKGMFIEMSTTTTFSPLNVSREAENIVNLFNSKYGTRFDPSSPADRAKLGTNHLTSERIG